MARAPRQREIAYSNPFLMTIGEEPVSSSRFPKWGQLLALRGTGPGVFAAYSRASALVARRSTGPGVIAAYSRTSVLVARSNCCCLVL